MELRQQSRIFSIALLAGLAACGPDEDVDLLALPPAERPSPEARLGIPEVAGEWSFAGWEIIEGDSTSLDRTFPSFGLLRFATQRLDSIAGTFELGGTPVPVVGDVRRDGHLTFVTLAGGEVRNFVAGIYQQDTLWLELSSVLPSDEWPRDARAAFVREGPSEPAFAWLRGARIPDIPPPSPLDSMAVGPSGSMEGSAGVAPSTPAGAAVGPAVEPAPAPAATSRPPVQSPVAQPQRPPVSQPGAQPPVREPTPQQPAQQRSPPPAAPQPENPPVEPTPEPAQPPPAPEPAPEIVQPPPLEGPGPLLGEPINP